jgi:BirA family biotin operon repressor/biotin-[acetyl-CoA-carboxylase] ligase
MVCAMSRVGFSDIRRFPSLDSTNRYLLDEARQGAPDGVVAVADHQTAGRGRLGRRWEAPPRACLLASVLLRPPLEREELPLCTAAVALSAADACGAVAAVEPGLKWPNDLVVGPRKLAGVLAEADGGGPSSGSAAVVVGVGLNVEWTGPPGAGGTSLAACGAPGVDREELLAALLDALEPRYRALGTDAGRRDLALQQRDRCVTLGQQVRVELATETFEGRAVDLEGPGWLVVDTANGRRRVTAGDVVHLRPV